MSNINDILKGEETEEVSTDLPLTKELGGKVYKIELLNAEDGVDLWEFLMQRMLPSIGTGLDSLQHDSNLDGSPTTFTQALIHLSGKLEGNTLKAISLSVLSGTTVDGKPLNFKEEFKGNYGHWKSLVAFALKENFSSFFVEGWAESLIQLTKMLKPVEGSPQQGSE
jgi:hypothetical protein|tara:strand:- start:447 stop:947 length:501 start_codon:yes stop_codon:yes gene_type:complete